MKLYDDPVNEQTEMESQLIVRRIYKDFFVDGIASFIAP